MPTNSTASSPSNTTTSSNYVSRVLDNDALKKGVAAAAAGVLVAVITEAIWPSDA